MPAVGGQVGEERSRPREVELLVERDLRPGRRAETIGSAPKTRAQNSTPSRVEVADAEAGVRERDLQEPQLAPVPAGQVEDAGRSRAVELLEHFADALHRRHAGVGVGAPAAGVHEVVRGDLPDHLRGRRAQLGHDQLMTLQGRVRQRADEPASPRRPAGVADRTRPSPRPHPRATRLARAPASSVAAISPTVVLLQVSPLRDSAHDVVCRRARPSDVRLHRPPASAASRFARAALPPAATLAHRIQPRRAQAHRGADGAVG